MSISFNPQVNTTKKKEKGKEIKKKKSTVVS